MPAKRTKEQQAAYMREYRMKKRAEAQQKDLAAMAPFIERAIVSRETVIPTAEQWKAIGGPTIMHEGKEMMVPMSLSRPEPKPGFLAAPDEDCVCGHDRHAYHLTGPCTAYIRPKTKCPCPGFMADLGFE